MRIVRDFLNLFDRVLSDIKVKLMLAGNTFAVKVKVTVIGGVSFVLGWQVLPSLSSRHVVSQLSSFRGKIRSLRDFWALQRQRARVKVDSNLALPAASARDVDTDNAARQLQRQEAREKMDAQRAAKKAELARKSTAHLDVHAPQTALNTVPTSPSKGERLRCLSLFALRAMQPLPLSDCAAVKQEST